MRILFKLKTYSQIIVATQLCLTIYKDDEVDIIINDSSKGFAETAVKMEASGLFNKVTYFPEINFNKFIMIQYLLKPHHLFGMLNNHYDAFIVNTYSRGDGALYKYLKKRNPMIILRLIEEGFLTRTYPLNITEKPKGIKERILNKLFYTRINPETESLFFKPELTNSKFVKTKISRIPPPDSSLLEKLNIILSYKNIQINEKFIFLDSSFAEDNIHLNYLSIFNNILITVGEDNLLVKLHPRQVSNPFNKNVHILKDYSFPWELWCMNNDTSDKIFISVVSGSSMWSNVVFGNKAKVILLYKLIKINIHHHVEYLEMIKSDIQKCCDFEWLFVPETMEELVDILKNNF